MFIPALELSKFCQVPRTDAERREKAAELARVWLTKRDCIFPKTTPIEGVQEDIINTFLSGQDILDPDLFWKEDIIQFAEDNGVASDPQVKNIINQSRSRYVSH